MSGLLFKLGSGQIPDNVRAFCNPRGRTANNSDGSATTVAVIRIAELSATQDLRAERDFGSLINFVGETAKTARTAGTDTRPIFAASFTGEDWHGHCC